MKLIVLPFDFLQLKENRKYYEHLFPLFTLCYSNSFSAFHYNKKGEINFEQVVSSGTSQGCCSGPLFLEIAKTPLLHYFSKMFTATSVADDIYLFNFYDFFSVPSNFAHFKQILAFAGFFLNEKKCKIISPTPIFSFDASIPVVCSPTPCLGVCVFPTPSPQPKETIEAIKRFWQKGNWKLEEIKKLNCSKQIKFLCLRSICFDTIYHLKSLPHSSPSELLFEKLEDNFFKTCLSILDLEKREKDPLLRVRIFSSIEDGGLGLFPLSSLRPYLLSSALSESAPLLSKLNLPPPSPEIGSTNEIKTKWRQIFKERLEIKNKIDPNSLEHSSWLVAWPYGQRVLSDDCFLFSINFRLGFLNPVIPHCRNNPSLTFKCNAECFDHVFSCCHCGGIFNHLRHEFINNNLSKLFTSYSIPHVLNPPDYPLSLTWWP